MSVVETAATPKRAHLWERHPEDWYVEPQWCSRRLFDVEWFQPGGIILDPACGLGRIVESATLAGYMAFGADIVSRGERCDRVEDFFESTATTGSIVSNPPFSHADAFVGHALRIATYKVALLLQTQWMNGSKRGAWLERTPLRRVWLLGPRPSMPPGPVVAAGEKPGSGTADYAWFVWQVGYAGAPELCWLRRGAAA